MLKANMRYIDLAFKHDTLNPIIDITFDIKTYAIGYPNRVNAKQIIDKWFERLGAL